MKFKSQKTYKRTSEVKHVKAPKGQFFLIPTFTYKRQTGEYPSGPTFFNDQGSVCCKLTSLWEVYEEGELDNTYVTKELAHKAARKYINEV